MKIIALVALALLAGTAVVVLTPAFHESVPLGNVPLNQSVTNSSSTCGIAVATMTAAFPQAQYRSWSNNGTATIYVWFSSTSTGMAAQTGKIMTASQTIEQSNNNGNLWSGTAFCITSAGTSTVDYTQW